MIELARGEEPRGRLEDVALDELVAEAVERARRHAPAARFERRRSSRRVVAGAARAPRPRGRQPARQRRQVQPAGRRRSRWRCAAASSRSATTARASPTTSAPHVFDRFYRGATARGRPGSGLGLAIVRQVAETHGGSVSVEDAAGGGALFPLRLPQYAVVARSVPRHGLVT